MYFDPRTQDALREVGLSTTEIRTASELVVEATREEASALESFFEGIETVFSDMDQAHSDEAFPEHTLEYVDLYTHAADLRGYVRFDGWGVPAEGGRVLEDGTLVELSLGPTVDDRVRFAHDRDAL
ncbi:DUF7532 family protein [Halorhabdus rudnickae]|uniref:DUF7532 family protein n=1 Tax=Halorhabdus rudnickae TaxID=1775544 RepID=UPI00108318CA|nr:hypothetical protein [Halorhabdus rudnickae]